MKSLLVLLVACSGKSAPHVDFKFDKPVSSSDLDEATRLVRDRVKGWNATVERKDDRIVVTSAYPRIAELVLPPEASIELRIVDDAAPYLADLVKHVRRDATAATLKITGINDEKMGVPDPPDRRLEVDDDFRAVNEQWADKHDCDKSDRIVGTGVYCRVTGEQALEAYFHGDKQLFVEPIDTAFAVPADHELVYQRLDDKKWRTHYLEREPFVLTSSNILGVTPDQTSLHVIVTNDAAAQLGARAKDKMVVTTKHMTVRGQDAQLDIPGTRDEVAALDYAFAFARFPAKLRQL